MRYGVMHPDKEKKYKELVNYGEIKASMDVVDNNGNDIRTRVIRYQKEIWFIHLENGEILEIFTV